MIDPFNAPGFLIRRLQQVSVQIFSKAAEGSGLSTVQYGALQIIEAQPGIDQISLSQLIDADRTTTARSVDRLFQAGLIVRQPNPADRRSNQLTITPAGRALMRELGARADRSQQELLAPLAPAERAEFIRMVRLLVYSHTQREPWSPTIAASGSDPAPDRPDTP